MTQEDEQDSFQRCIENIVDRDDENKYDRLTQAIIEEDAES